MTCQAQVPLSNLPGPGFALRVENGDPFPLPFGLLPGEL